MDREGQGFEPPILHQPSFEQNWARQAPLRLHHPQHFSPFGDLRRLHRGHRGADPNSQRRWIAAHVQIPTLGTRRVHPLRRRSESMGVRALPQDRIGSSIREAPLPFLGRRTSLRQCFGWQAASRFYNINVRDFISPDTRRWLPCYQAKRAVSDACFPRFLLCRFGLNLACSEARNA